MRALVDLFIMAVKFVVLFIVLFRFHGSWIGVAVVLGMAVLLFRLDRALVRFATDALGARR